MGIRVGSRWGFFFFFWLLLVVLLCKLLSTFPGARIQGFLYGSSSQTFLAWGPLLLLEIIKDPQRPFAYVGYIQQCASKCLTTGSVGEEKKSRDCSVCWFLWSADPTLITPVLQCHWGVESLGRRACEFFFEDDAQHVSRVMGQSAPHNTAWKLLLP